MEEKDLMRLREEIDRIDDDLIRILNQRADCALRIGRLKQERGVPAFDACREREVIEALVARNRGPLPDPAVQNVFTEIISACRALQAPTQIAYLGPEATFTHLAAMEFFGRSCQFVPKDSIADVFREVERGLADFGVVPVENSNEGSVGLTLDQLAGSELKICGEILSRISHALMSAEKDFSRIETVFSHPQALAQCLGWLTDKLPGRVMMPVSSTSAAARRSAEEERTAAIGSELLAEIYQLNVLARDIQDSAMNQTRFLVLGTVDNRPTERDKTSILFATLHDPGALREALTPFAERGINLTRIESRPSKERPWEYVFFCDFEGHLADTRIEEALDALRASAKKLKILGSYPMGELIDRRSESSARDLQTLLRRQNPDGARFCADSAEKIDRAAND
ncbi:MAG: prephenate dehydratase [Desulfomonile tiedjei]|nr:prephenate dehydratase [Desulfomonile tiedjei]